MCVGMVAGVVGSWAINSRADTQPASQIGRYGLSATESAVYKIDTQTGEVWEYNGTSHRWNGVGQ